MSKYRIYELAKEYNTTSKVIIDILARNNITAKNHMSSVDDAAKAVIDRTFARKAGVAPAAEKNNGSKPADGERISQIDAGEAPGRNGLTRQSRSGIEKRHSSEPHRSQVGEADQRTPEARSGQSSSKQQTKPAGHTGQQSRPKQQNQQNQSNQQNRQTQYNQHNQQRNQQHSPQRSKQMPQQNLRGQQSPQPQRPQQTPGQRPTGSHQDSGTRYNEGARRPVQANNNKKRGANGPKQQQGKDQHAAGSTNTKPSAPVSTVKAEPPKPKIIKLGEPLTVKELAGKLGREVSEVIKKLMMLGVMATINQEVDLDTATILAEEFGVKVEELPPEEDPTEIPEIEDDPDSLLPRPPVVTIMGHVDHGKTSLLDAIRQTHVTATEAGGITQHIGAYQVNYQGKKIVFLDTPGHEAFTAMRARGAQVTDIAILVVAADDGVMPQTIEAINHAKAAKVPIIVAINKIDRPGANPDRVKQQLAEHGLIAEDWGGDTIMVPVSALKKTGLADLLEMILLVAEMQELKANPNRPAYGTIIEAQLDKGRGPVATVLVQKGTLRVGDIIIAGTAYGKVRAMVNDRGDKVKKAEPATPVEVLGLSDVPQAGDILVAVDDEKKARSVAEKRLAKKRSEELQQAQKVSLDDLFKQIQEGNIKDLNIVIKADVQGSVEALRQALVNLKNKEVRVNIVHGGVGAINESDVMLASASNALIIGFNVRPDANARKAAETEKVDIRTYRVIYDAINDVEAAMTGMLAPEYKEVLQGRVEVRQVISIPKGLVAGSYVLEGKITNSSQVRVIRNGIVVHEGKVESLRRFKDDVKEVAAGFECGITIERYRDIKVGDIIEAFTMEVVK
ncbi:translation initiation factor IF-2 [Sporolituus thermophilus]|uniref:Translation initiation factor IF-2 n=1 Tax=Sporolituus thermophilus DSM 23256 TaxID=1123285 RepID=A0A1G7I1K5_9FIRM|nr:translation initiation factor IF-2 [Sporolituus thermophilus]SDF06453.1 translation initiation factor IF-2 [Sporolituus thermophilus DSM 23256]